MNRNASVLASVLASVVASSAILLLTSSCMLAFDDNEPARCGTGPQPELAAGGVRNPNTLACEIQQAVDCEDVPVYFPGAPVTWGACASACQDRAETACEATAGCRVVRDAWCLADGATCPTTFAGCFPTDTQTSSIDCFAAEDGDTCSRDARCTAWHETNNARLTQDLAQQFAVCAPAGVDPGRCEGVVTCRAAAPVCGVDRVPGIADGCYTGACLPASLCAVPLAAAGA